jgi:hypothetical protein
MRPLGGTRLRGGVGAPRSRRPRGRAHLGGMTRSIRSVACSNRRRGGTSIECSRWSAAARPKVPASRRRPSVRVGINGERRCLLAPEHFRGTTSITYLRTGERIADAPGSGVAGNRPGGLVIAELFHESGPGDGALLRRLWRSPTRSSPATECHAWGPTRGHGPHCPARPLPPEAVTHPRTAGAVGRAPRLFRKEGAPLMEAVPAPLAHCRGNRRRGPRRCAQGSGPRRHRRRSRRVRRGACDRPGDVRRPRPSSGMAHVIVGGTFRGA